MSEKNLQVRLVHRPVGLPKATDFELVESDVPTPGERELVVRNVYLSLDPAMRGWMNDVRSYVPPVQLGEVMRGGAIGEVVASNHRRFPVGTLVRGLLGWQRYARVDGKGLAALPPMPDGVPLSAGLGVLGMPGLTAYFGLLDVGQPRSGETVVVSGAAGAVGSLVGQIARIQGCRVVGTAGGEKKRAWLLDELGFDAAIDYRATDDLHVALKQACPDGIDVYFDNVGGPTLDTVLRSINLRARIVICGAISQYNATEPVPGPANYLSLLVNRARMEGFIVMDYAHRAGEAFSRIGEWIQEGKIHFREHVVDGLEKAPEALLRLFDGSHDGKLIVRIGPEPAR